MILLVFAVMIRADVALQAVQVIGGNITVMHGDTAVLPCILKDTTEKLNQISWQRKTKGNPQNNNFFTILRDGPEFINGHDERFSFLGSLTEKNGSLQLSSVTLMDQGTYTCIFTLFPSGNHKTEIPLNVLVPPIISMKDDLPTLTNEEVSLATCTASGSQPPAEVSWRIGNLTDTLKITTNSATHANGTTTTVSKLLGVPTRDLDRRSVQCVVTSAALSKEIVLPFTIQLYFPPTEVSVREKSPDSFECVSNGNPNPQFTWTRSDRPQLQSAVRVDGAELQILSMTSELNGLFNCEASNPFGNKHAHLYVHVTSGTCPACWTLFGLCFALLILLLVGAAMWHYKCGLFPRTEEQLHVAREQVRTSETPEDALREEVDLQV